MDACKAGNVARNAGHVLGEDELARLRHVGERRLELGHLGIEDLIAVNDRDPDRQRQRAGLALRSRDEAALDHDGDGKLTGVVARAGAGRVGERSLIDHLLRIVRRALGIGPMVGSAVAQRDRRARALDDRRDGLLLLRLLAAGNIETAGGTARVAGGKTGCEGDNKKSTRHFSKHNHSTFRILRCRGKRHLFPRTEVFS